MIYFKNFISNWFHFFLMKFYQRFFKSNHPARACYQVAALPKGAKVEIEAVAVNGEIVEA